MSTAELDQYTMELPLVDLKRQHAGLRTEIERAISAVMNSAQFFLGPNTRAFEQEFAAYTGARECIGASDGTGALYLALRACGIGPGDEVITVSHTFFATVEAITMTGATPVFVDIDPSTYTMDTEVIEAAITPRTRAVLPVHLFGAMADMPRILEIARHHGLRVIEDACQAHGARKDGRMAGTFGDVGCFSFYYSKNLGAYGEAGGVITDDPEIARRVRLLRDHGSEKRYHHQLLGLNSRLDEVQSAVLRIKLPFLDAWNEARRRHAARYITQLAGLPIGLPSFTGVDHVFHLFVIRTPERDALRAHLERRGVHTGIHYPIPCHLQPACASFSNGSGSLPVTERVTNEILSLPMFPELRDEEIDWVGREMADFFYSASVDLTSVA